MKIPFTILICCFLQLNSAFGQVSDDVKRIIENASVYTTVETPPTFPGGLDSLKSYLKRNVIYPDIYRKLAYKERLFVKFVVEKDGSVSNVQLIQGGFKEFEKEAIRLVENMPPWSPGLQNGKPLRTYFTLPVKFCPAGCTGW